MDKTLSGKYSKIKRRYGEVRKKRAISLLNIATCTAAFNDNLFKFLTIYLLIDMKGAESSSDVALLAGVFYVLPFLLFSSISGAIADRFSKQKIIVWMKAFEILIVALGFYVYANGLVWGCYGCVFLLSLQSAIMSPPKYSIILELVGKEQVTKANSYVTSYTYLAIIMGTFMASFLTQITNRNFILSLSVCMIAAVIGYIASLNIPKTVGVGEKITANKKPFGQLTETLQICKKTPKLLLVVIGSAFFLFIGAFLQLNLIPFAMISLKMSEVGGGYLFLATSLGIAAGSIISGKVCKREVHLGLSAFAMVCMAFFVLCIPMASPSIAGVVIALGLIGLFGGLYQIPLESYMQTYCSPEKRGKVVAAANFLSFAGVLLAPLSMAVFEKGLGVSPATGFIMLGLILIGASIVLVKSLFIPLVNFLSKGIFHKFYDIYYQDFPFTKKHEEQRVALFIKGIKKRFIFLLFGETMHAHAFIIRKEAKRFDNIISWINGLDILYLDQGIDAKNVRARLSGLLTKTRPLFLLDTDVNLDDLKSFIGDLKSEYHYHVKDMVLVNRVHFRPCFDQIWQKTSLVFAFNCIKKDSLISVKKPEVQLI
ncbi:MAG: Lysophospholipid transporter LplT [Chlamydiia bacterium]|nr:Lysophospholipid transporter LplT [Chlamydiia bacterium]